MERIVVVSHGLSVVLAFLLSGCVLSPIGSPIDMHTAPPRDWPKLNTYRWHDPAYVRDKCGVLAMACTVVFFERNECYMVFTVVETDEYFPYLYDHEIEHCRGRDHIGSTSLRDAWARHKTILVEGNL